MITKKQVFHFVFLTLAMLSVSFVSYADLNQVSFAEDEADGSSDSSSDGSSDISSDSSEDSKSSDNSGDNFGGDSDENANNNADKSNGVSDNGNNLQQLNNNYMSDGTYKKQEVNLSDKYSGLNPAGHDVVIYTKKDCPYCTRAIEILREYNVSFTEIVPQNQAEKDEMIKRADGRRTFPEIFIDDELVGGCQELMEIDESGELAKMLK